MYYLCTTLKQKGSTYGVLLAITLLLLLSLFPHHHHEGGAACWVTEVCQQDGRANDAHTAHGHEHGHHVCFWQTLSVVQHGVRGVQSLGDEGGGTWVFLPTDFWGAAWELPHFEVWTLPLPIVQGRLMASCGKCCLRRGPPMEC